MHPSAQCPVPSERITRSPLLTHPLRSLLCITAFYTLTSLPLQAENNSTIQQTDNAIIYVKFTDPYTKEWKISTQGGAEPIFTYYGPFDKNFSSTQAKGYVSITPLPDYEISDINSKDFETGTNFGEKRITYKYNKKDSPDGEKINENQKKQASILVRASFGEFSQTDFPFPTPENSHNTIDTFLSDFSVEAIAKRESARDYIYSDFKKQSPNSSEEKIQEATNTALIQYDEKIDTYLKDLKKDAQIDLKNKKPEFIKAIDELFVSMQAYARVKGTYSYTERQWVISKDNPSINVYGFPTHIERNISSGVKLSLQVSAKISNLFSDITVSCNIPIEWESSTKISISGNAKPPLFSDKMNPSMPISVSKSLEISYTTSSNYSLILTGKKESMHKGDIAYEDDEKTLDAGIKK